MLTQFIILILKYIMNKLTGVNSIKLETNDNILKYIRYYVIYMLLKYRYNKKIINIFDTKIGLIDIEYNDGENTRNKIIESPNISYAIAKFEEYKRNNTFQKNHDILKIVRININKTINIMPHIMRYIGMNNKMSNYMRLHYKNIGEIEIERMTDIFTISRDNMSCTGDKTIDNALFGQ